MKNANMINSEIKIFFMPLKGSRIMKMTKEDISFFEHRILR